MRIKRVGLILGLAIACTWAAEGLVELRSAYGVEETSRRLVDFFRQKGIRLFKVIDHAEGARRAHMSLRPTKLLIFGNPYLGTPVMECAQTAAIDLPQKMLIYQNARGETVVAYNDPDYLFARHGIPRECSPEIRKKMKTVLAKIARYAAGSAR